MTNSNVFESNTRTYTEEEKAALEARIAELEKESKKLKAERILRYVFAGVSVVAAAYCCKKLKDVSGVVNSAVTDIANTTFIDVQQAVVDKAVERAAQNAANRAVKATEDMMKVGVERAVSTAVYNSKTALKDAVTDKIAREVAEIDKTELIADVTDKAKRLILEKFDGKLDGIAAEFSHNLESIGKVYQGIAEKMQSKAVGGI